MSWLKRHTLTAAIVCLLLAFALWHFYPGVPAQWVFLGLGGALLLLSLAFNAGEARTAMGTRTARYGAGAAVMAVLALGIVVAANAISLRHSVRWDFTENKRNSVSPQTIQVLRTLKAPVERDRLLPLGYAGQEDGGGPAHPVRDLLARQVHVAPGGHRPGARPGPAATGSRATAPWCSRAARPGRSAPRRCRTPRRRSSPTPSSRSPARASGSSTCSRGTASARSGARTGPASARPRSRWRRPTTRSRTCSWPATRRSPRTRRS